MSRKKRPLTDVEIGACCEIVSINSSCKNRDRLIELGFTSKTEITPLHSAPIGGDPRAYLLRGGVMALRSEDACEIITKSKEENR